MERRTLYFGRKWDQGVRETRVESTRDYVEDQLGRESVHPMIQQHYFYGIVAALTIVNPGRIE
jgi:hypothetical protein